MTLPLGGTAPQKFLRLKALEAVQSKQEKLKVALKKSELYSSLWSSCDALRGGMDASQYKDYVLVLLFIKYISDKYAGQPFAPITIPPGASFKNMVALKGTSDIGDQINKKIIAPLDRRRGLRLCG
jgi:type I restriction enzyme M protein